MIKTIEFKNGILNLIDQRVLPLKEEIYECSRWEAVELAIKNMVVRGAPAIGDAAAYGVVLAAKQYENLKGSSKFLSEMDDAMERLRESRPTAVNLMWAIDRMKALLLENYEEDNIYEILLAEADKILDEDAKTCHKLGEYGNELIEKGDVILTHCNAGALATAEWGTALGVIRSAFYDNKDIFVYADETRPRLQGAKLTAWELKKEKIPFKLIPDSVAATLIRDGKINKIFVGADRIASNGDAANKIGTFMLSVIAKQYNIPFYIVAPTSTIDFEISDGSQIEIEERDISEVVEIEGIRIAPYDIEVYNPAFDVTPNEFISGIITEFGVLSAPYKESINKVKELII